MSEIDNSEGAHRFAVAFSVVLLMFLLLLRFSSMKVLSGMAKRFRGCTGFRSVYSSTREHERKCTGAFRSMQ